MMNNQPMGFYHSATLIKDAQRHGLRVKPVDVTCSEWLCTIEPDMSMRLGFRYVRGLREQAGRAIVRERARGNYTSIENLTRRVPELRKDEVRMLAKVGALNFINDVHRRDALWEAERVTRPVGPLLEQLEAVEGNSPLARMNVKERMHADFSGTGVTVGRHPMALYRPELNQQGVWRAIDLAHCPEGRIIKVAGAVIVRQRPGTAKGFFFMSLEDETGIANVIVKPDTFEENRITLLENAFLIVEGVLQNQQNAISIRAGRAWGLDVNAIPVPSHDFH
jgi:error-prone DNA polymerase